jgi:hypothetical protein
MAAIPPMSAMPTDPQSTVPAVVPPLSDKPFEPVDTGTS